MEAILVFTEVILILTLIPVLIAIMILFLRAKYIEDGNKIKTKSVISYFGISYTGRYPFYIGTNAMSNHKAKKYLKIRNWFVLIFWTELILVLLLGIIIGVYYGK